MDVVTYGVPWRTDFLTLVVPFWQSNTGAKVTMNQIVDDFGHGHFSREGHTTRYWSPGGMKNVTSSRDPAKICVHGGYRRGLRGQIFAGDLRGSVHVPVSRGLGVKSSRTIFAGTREDVHLGVTYGQFWE